MTFIPPETGKPCPCCGRVIDALPDDVAQAVTEIARQQTPLGREFEAAWDRNIDKLYET